MNRDRERLYSFESFDEKREDSAIMIEQLQRELHHTVDAMHQQQHATQRGLENKVHSSNMYNECEHTHYSSSTHNMHMLGSSSASSNLNDLNKFGTEEKSIVDFLRQSQESSTRQQLDCNYAQDEVRRLKNDVLSLRDQNKRLIENLEQMNTARRDAEGKLQFRMRQVMELEQKQLVNTDNDSKLTLKVADLQQEMRKMQSIVAEAQVETKVANTKSTILEKSLQELQKKEVVPLHLYVELQKDVENQRLEMTKLQTALAKSKASVDKIKTACNIPSQQNVFMTSEQSTNGVEPTAAGVQAAMNMHGTHNQSNSGKQFDLKQPDVHHKPVINEGHVEKNIKVKSQNDHSPVPKLNKANNKVSVENEDHSINTEHRNKKQQLSSSTGERAEVPTSFSCDSESSTAVHKNASSKNKNSKLSEKMKKTLPTKDDSSMLNIKKKNNSTKTTGQKKTKTTETKTSQPLKEKKKIPKLKVKKDNGLKVETVFDAIPIETLSSPINDSIASSD